MKKYFYILILISCISCQKEKSILRDTISFEITTYQNDNKTKASAMPQLKEGSELVAFKGRFDYLLLNIPKINGIDKFNERDSINSLYPDTSGIKQIYLDRYCKDKKLVKYFWETYEAIKSPDLQITHTYAVDELMEVSSKFFYCDLVNPDTSIQAHVCIGLNGVKEAKWEKDYTLLAAFCYEGIFHQFKSENSLLWDSFVAEKKRSCERFKMNITTLDQYLEDVKLNLFERMKNNHTLKKELLDYYELNKTNVAFKITN